MKINTLPGWALWLFSLMPVLLTVQSCKPDDPDPVIEVETGDILHEPYEKKNGFSVRCVRDR